ncbi:MAG: double-strand break repair protein AddB [Methylocystis sp.]|nr:MAG: double-strand break repair protein AddB [Methylocystis sp.]
MAAKSNVFTIPPGAPFLETFVDAFLAGDIIAALSRESPPLAMARATIYVPTRRAGRALAAQFARTLHKRAALLPRILPLGGLEEREATELFGGAFDFDEELTQPIEEIERRFLLAQLVAQWSKTVGHAIVSINPDGVFDVDRSEPFLVASSPSGAYALAAELGALIDEFIIEGVASGAIGGIVDDAFDPYWSITTTFLRIALEQWPHMLRERGQVDAASRQKRLVETQIARLADDPAHPPVIALGSTGAQPTTARLLAAIAAQGSGAVVLPGLDREMGEAAWARVGENEDEPAFTHPQTVLKRLLGVMRLKREEVRELGRISPRLDARRALVAQAMLPPDATAAWRNFRDEKASSFSAALEDVCVLEAPDERTEALTLALFMREALETPGKTAALVTPERSIARRVAVELRRFAIEIDDSGGSSLAATGAGALARQAAAIGAEGLNAVNIAALLAHPLTRLGHSRARIETVAPLLEIGVLRSIPVGADGYGALLEAAHTAAQSPHAHPAARRITQAQWDEIGATIVALENAFASFRALSEQCRLAELVTAHRAAFEAIALGADETSDEGAPVLFELFDRLTAADAPEGFDAAAYAALFDRIVFETTLRGPARAHPRLKILGPLEARLLDADIVLLAGLDEGVWPPQTDTGPFLNRSMRRQLGLSPPERRIGQAAHDFVMALGAKSVVLSRAAKRNGSPTVASRFLARLEALAGEALVDCKARGDQMLAIAHALDRPRADEVFTLGRPAPRPALDIRPTKLSVTRIETLRRDPYAIFAEKILALQPLAPLGAQIGAREQGTAIHEALHQFVLAHPSGPLPVDAREALCVIARDLLADFFADPAFETFTWPRIVDGLNHALAFERERRASGSIIFMETGGSWTFPLADGSHFTLTAKADRIEVDPAGEAFVFDYKTGAPPTQKQVEAGWAPQLTLEAAMIEAGAFKEIGARPVSGAAYVGLKNGGKTQHIKASPFSDLVADHRAQLVTMLSEYRQPKTPYPSRPFVALTSHAGDYDHLARVKEWSRGGEGA